MWSLAAAVSCLVVCAPLCVSPHIWRAGELGRWLLEAAALRRGGGVLPSPRDAQVVGLVGQFRLVSAEQIRDVLFSDQASKTPLDRALKRLTDAGYLARIGRMVGGFGGGSGQYVYQLGRVGWRYLGKGGGYRPLRVIDHQLTALAKSRIRLMQYRPGLIDGFLAGTRLDLTPLRNLRNLRSLARRRHSRLSPHIADVGGLSAPVRRLPPP